MAEADLGSPQLMLEPLRFLRSTRATATESPARADGCSEIHNGDTTVH